MTSIQLFFDSLCPTPIDHHRDPTIAIKQMINTTPPTDMTNKSHQFTKPQTLGEYLALLCTPTCFVPVRMLYRIHPQHSVTCPLPNYTAWPTITTGHGKNQTQFTTPARFDIPSIRIANANPRLPIANVSLHHSQLTHVLPAQLDHPPDDPRQHGYWQPPFTIS